MFVCVQALDKLKLPRTNCLAYTMPGFATGEATKSYATELMQRCASRRTSSTSTELEVMLKDSATYAKEPVYDVTFEKCKLVKERTICFGWRTTKAPLWWAPVICRSSR